jgi:hypothetical protein
MKEQLIAALLAQGYRVFTRPFELNIVGIRNHSLVPNVFNDTINAVHKDDMGEWQLRSYPATTDPGTYWLDNPSNPLGTAILKAGQYIGSHIMGLHRGKYMALVQRNPVTVIRDSKRNGTLDFSGKEETGLFGINIHRAMEAGVTKSIDRYSAGCQVFANAADFAAFMGLGERHKLLYGNSYTYTLLQETEQVRMAA